MRTTATAAGAPARPFTGFTRDAIDFLVELAEHNERSWFQPRKAEYERLLKDPLEALCLAVGEEFDRRGLPLVSDPARSPFRIYRDVRFSRDKSPYKTHVSASFPWRGQGRGSGGYFHMAPGEIFVGGGMWHPEPPRLAAWRSMILDQPEKVHGAVDDPDFVRTFDRLDGDKLKRAPAGIAADHPDVELLKLKDITFGHRLSDDEAFSPSLPVKIVDTLAAAVPVLELLAQLPVDEPVPDPGWLHGHGR